MTMKSGSYYEGTINGENSGKSIKLTLDKKSEDRTHRQQLCY
ncbi:MAG: hypothetical protein V8R14_02575 [Clostridia bacterium]